MSLPFAQKPQPTPGQLPRLSARVLLASSMNLQLVCGEERKAVWFVKQFQWGLNCFCQTACIIKAKWILCALNFPRCGFLKHAVLSSDLHHSLGGDWVVSGCWACMFPKGGKRSVGANRHRGKKRDWCWRTDMSLCRHREKGRQWEKSVRQCRQTDVRDRCVWRREGGRQC